MQAVSPPARKVGFGTKMAYGFGSIAYGIKDNGFQTLLLLYYNQVIGLDGYQVGLAILIALVLDAFIDPVVGHYSDHLRSTWGRRHPFMYAAALPVGILYLLLWSPPTGNPAVTIAYLVLIAVLVRTAISCYEVPSSALAPELTADYHERTSVLGYRYLFGWLGGMTMGILVYTVFLPPTKAYPNGLLNPAGYHHYAIAASVAMVLAIVISAAGTHREIKYLPKASPTRTNLSETFRGIRTTLKNKAFLMLLISGIFGFTAQGLTFALSVYFNSHFWQFDTRAIGAFTFSVMGGVVLAFMISSFASRRIGKRATGALCGAIYPIVSVVPFILRFAGLFPANGSPLLMPLLLLIVMIATAFGVALSITSASMMADVVEDAQMKTGERSEGLFFAGSFFMQKCVSGLGLFLSGIILDLVHFPKKAVVGQVPADVLRNLITTYGSLLVVLGLASAYFVWRFPLGGKTEHERRLAELAEIESHAFPLPGSEPEIAAADIVGGGGKLSPAE